MEGKVLSKSSQHRIERPTPSAARVIGEHFVPDVIVCILKVDTELLDTTNSLGPAVPIQRHRDSHCKVVNRHSSSLPVEVAAPRAH
jgi:hypothetical protein